MDWSKQVNRQEKLEMDGQIFAQHESDVSENFPSVTDLLAFLSWNNPDYLKAK